MTANAARKRLSKLAPTGILCAALTAWGAFVYAGEPGVLVLNYHNVPTEPNNDPCAVDLRSLVEQIDYLRLHGYNFIGPDDMLKAGEDATSLPKRPVLLTFDDGYVSFASNVLPVLELYGCPAVLGICTAWLEQGSPEGITAPLLGWKELRPIAAHPLVTIASHSHDLHHTHQYNPHGNAAWAGNSRRYFPGRGTYEDEAAFRSRIRKDLRTSRRLLRKRLGVDARIIVWPYGEYNAITIDEAKQAGFTMAMALGNGLADPGKPYEISRETIENNPHIHDFVLALADWANPASRPDALPRRAVQIDLDTIYDTSAEQTERNLDALLDRIVEMGADAVYLQAFADPDGDGNVDSVYFPNRVLPMRMDLLSRVANQLFIRGISVHIWMPVLSFVLPDQDLAARLRVMEAGEHGPEPSTASYARLSPFSDEALSIVSTIYEDFAAHARFHGVLFQDDAYLADGEDFNPVALATIKREMGLKTFDPDTLTEKQKAQWTRLKTAQLNRFTEGLMQAVRKYRPAALFARNLYAPVLGRPHSEEWFAQNYADSLNTYDSVVIMAYAELEGVRHPLPWLEGLVEAAARHPEGLAKTVFKLQAYDWAERRWVPDNVMLDRVRRLTAAGAQAIAYYPDDVITDHPSLKKIRTEMSARTQFLLPPVPPPLRHKQGTPSR